MWLLLLDVDELFPSPPKKKSVKVAKHKLILSPL